MENSEPEKVPTLMTTGLVVVSVVFPALSLICVILRFRARYVTCAPLLEDEWWILASWVRYVKSQKESLPKQLTGSLQDVFALS